MLVAKQNLVSQFEKTGWQQVEFEVADGEQFVSQAGCCKMHVMDDDAVIFFGIPYPEEEEYLAEYAQALRDAGSDQECCVSIGENLTRY